MRVTLTGVPVGASCRPDGTVATRRKLAVMSSGRESSAIMPPFEQELSAALDDARRSTLIDHVRSNPDITIGELVNLDGGLGQVAASVTVRELLLGGPALRGGARSPRPKASRRGRRRELTAKRDFTKRSNKAVNTRTSAGRRQYDAAVLEAVRGSDDGARADRIKLAVGGTPLQVRTSLHRLKSAKLVHRKGKARATTWHAK